MKLTKDHFLWIAEQRGVAVYVRKGKAGTAPVPKVKAFKTEALAAEYLENEIEARLADGYVITDPEATLSAPFTLTGVVPAPRPVPERFRDVENLVHAVIAGGFMDPEDVPQFIDELVGECVRPPPGVRAALERSADAARTKRRSVPNPAPCVNDAIDAAFDQLNRRGVVAIQSAGARIGTAFDDARADAFLEAKRRRQRGLTPRGFCVYGLRELERGVRGEGLRLDWGAFDGVDAGEIARLVLDALREYGVEASWSGKAGDAVVVSAFEWCRA